MIQQNFSIENKTGLHARPAAKFVKEANKYKSVISLCKNGRKADAKSIIGILGLGIAQGSQITVQAHGEDEEQALVGLGALIYCLAREEE